MSEFVNAEAVILSSLFAVADRHTVEAALYELAHRYVKLQEEYNEIFERNQALLDSARRLESDEEYDYSEYDEYEEYYGDVELDESCEEVL
jgi:hypothetical protein